MQRTIQILLLTRDPGLEAELAAFAAEMSDEARLELANAQIAQGERDAAADNLFHIIEADREWNEGAAKGRLLKLFEVVGLEDPWVSQQRRRLSAILFG